MVRKSRINLARSRRPKLREYKSRPRCTCDALPLHVQATLEHIKTALEVHSQVGLTDDLRLNARARGELLNAAQSVDMKVDKVDQNGNPQTP